MKEIHNLTLIGTSHIADESVKLIKKTIKEDEPDIVAVELDKNRLYGLLNQKKRSHFSIRQARELGATGFLFAMIASFIQNKLGKIVRVEPGKDMLTAVKEAKKHNKKIALIDQNINITLKKLSKEFTAKEKFRIVADIFKGIFFRKREMKKYGLENLDLTKVPEKKMIKIAIDQIKIRYPNLYKVLIHDRNIFMARNLSRLMMENPHKKILAVVGAGHEEEMIKLIENNTKISYTFTVN